jgi:hypothetical protein
MEEKSHLSFYRGVFHGFLPWKHNSVTLRNKEAEYIASSVQSNMASQDFDRFT